MGHSGTLNKRTERSRTVLKRHNVYTNLFIVYHTSQNTAVIFHLNLDKRLGLGKVPLTNGGFRKLREVSVNKWKKPLIFKTLTEWISHLKKKFTAKKKNRSNEIYRFSIFR